jgi:hypothetical protein
MKNTLLLAVLLTLVLSPLLTSCDQNIEPTTTNIYYIDPDQTIQIKIGGEFIIYLECYFNQAQYDFAAWTTEYDESALQMVDILYTYVHGHEANLLANMKFIFKAIKAGEYKIIANYTLIWGTPGQVLETKTFSVIAS